MFKRRKPRSFLKKGKEFFWPSMGFRRTYFYIRHRILRIADTQHNIAGGLAIGVAVSFSPLVGTHLIQAGLLAYIFRLNVLAALFGTLVGNPSTFPFMWWAAISFGSFLFGLFGLPANTILPETMNFEMLGHIIMHQPLRIFLPWLMGGYLLALIVWPLCYFIFYNLVKGAKIAREKARMRKVHKAAKSVTGQKK